MVVDMEHTVPPPPVSGKITLLVKHLPEALHHDTLTRLFSHYGATDVRPCVAGKLRNCAFVDFKDEADASRVQSQFNRLGFLNKVLAVERASSRAEALQQVPEVGQAGKKETGVVGVGVGVGVVGGGIVGRVGNMDAVESLSTSAAAPIAPTLGIDYPFPPHLQYSYPPPDGNILTNIVNALIAVPRLYTQVLHLMNKMNLPPPFCAAMPTPPLPPAPPPEPPPLLDVPLPPPPQQQQQHTHSSTDESELQSSSSEHGGEEVDEEMRSSRRVRKKRKIDVGLPPKDLTPAVVHKPGFGPLIKKKAPVMQFKLGVKKSVEKGAMSGGGERKGTEVERGGAHDGGGPEVPISKEWLRQHRVPPEDILATPMFKNYAAGVPTQVLYIKNLAKDVTVDDLLHIFEVFLNSREEAQSLLTIKLMQEGRMKGQAFITFPTVELAQEALDCGHGYKLKEKAMVIQFGRKPIDNSQNCTHSSPHMDG